MNYGKLILKLINLSRAIDVPINSTIKTNKQTTIKQTHGDLFFFLSFFSFLFCCCCCHYWILTARICAELSSSVRHALCSLNQMHRVARTKKWVLSESGIRCSRVRRNQTLSGFDISSGLRHCNVAVYRLFMNGQFRDGSQFDSA